MNYIYDILLNFSSGELYEFFEWRGNDGFEHVRKIPLFKVSNQDFYTLRNHTVRVSNTFLETIKNKTEIFNNRFVKVFKYGCIFTNGMDAFAVKFKGNGLSFMKSNLLLDENEEVLDFSNRLREATLEYEVLDQERFDCFTTRLEREKKHYLMKELKTLYETKNVDKLKYLYYEWYDKMTNDMDVIYQGLVEIIQDPWSMKHNQLYDLVKLTHLNNQ